MKLASTQELIPAAAGTPFAGGIFLGCFFLGHQAFASIGAPRAAGELARQQWHETYEHVAGALSVYDGQANTLAMAAAGSALGRWALDLRIDGRDDWYVPARGESLLGYAADLRGDEAFSKSDPYWTSTQNADDPYWAWAQWFYYGIQHYTSKGLKLLVRAVRREPIQLFHE